MNNALYRLFARYWLVIVLITAVVTVASALADKARPKGVTTSFDLTVATVQPSPTSGQVILQPDALGSTSTLADTVVAWLQQPTTADAAIKAAKVSVPDTSIRSLAQFFKAKGLGGADIQVQYDTASSADAQAVYDGLHSQLNAMAASYNSGQIGSPQMNLIYGAPLSEGTTSIVPLLPVAGFVIGLVFAVVVVAVADRRRS